ncbi:MAG: M48 family metallopeptidase [Acidobacteriota bacterium]
MRSIGNLTRLSILTLLLAWPHPASAGPPKNSDVENIGNRDINKGSWNLISLEKEMALGRALSQEIERHSKLMDDPIVTEYINRLSQNLVRNSDAKVPFTVKVIDSDEINAMALPGGFLYVNSGLITAADAEAEVAGVIAHEIAHVTARHATEQQTKATLVNYASIPLIFVGGGLGQILSNAVGFLIPLQFLQFSRKAETEADYLGLQYMYKAGYDPTGFVSFFEKLQAKDKKAPGKLAVAFSTHPPTTDRIEKTEVNIATVLPERDQYIVNTSEFDAVKARLLALENRRKPAADDPKRPTLKRRNHPDDQVENGESDDEGPPVLQRRTLSFRVRAGVREAASPFHSAN